MSQAERGRQPDGTYPTDWLDDAIAQLAQVREIIAENYEEGRKWPDPSTYGPKWDLLKFTYCLGYLIVAEDFIKAILNERSDLRDTDEVAYYRLQTILFAKVAANCRMFAEQWAVEGVQHGALSRVQAAEMLGVHQGTVARWVKDAAKNSGMQNFRRHLRLTRVDHINLDKALADERIDNDDES